MDENNPVAPTGQEAPASVASTNTNEQAPATQTEAPAAPAEPTAEQIAKYLGTTTEGLEKFKKFSDNNGGFDKVFAERKKEITTPPAQQPQTQEPIQQMQPQRQQENMYGGLNPRALSEELVMNHYKELASKPEYANIADKLLDGTVMDEANKKFGIEPIVNGEINRKQIKEFCDMYSKTMPALQASSPMTNTPTAQATGEEFNGPITTTQDALKVIQENAARVASGQGEHSKLQEAQNFLAKGFADRHPKQKEFTPWAGQK